MKKSMLLFVILSVLLLNTSSPTQENKAAKETPKKTDLQSEELNRIGKNLDNEVLNINKKISEVISKYNLLTTKDISILPYRVSYRLGSDYIEIENYEIKRDFVYDDRILGMKRKIIRAYISGQNITRIESEIIDEEYMQGRTLTVKMVDPSPLQEGTDDVIFTQMVNNKKLIDGRKLGDIRNNRIFPIKNNLKREFLIPHVQFLYDTVLSIAESYYKGLKDSDITMSEFLKKSTEY